MTDYSRFSFSDLVNIAEQRNIELPSQISRTNLLILLKEEPRFKPFTEVEKFSPRIEVKVSEPKISPKKEIKIPQVTKISPRKEIKVTEKEPEISPKRKDEEVKSPKRGTKKKEEKLKSPKKVEPEVKSPKRGTKKKEEEVKSPKKGTKTEKVVEAKVSPHRKTISEKLKAIRDGHHKVADKKSPKRYGEILKVDVDSESTCLTGECLGEDIVLMDYQKKCEKSMIAILKKNHIVLCAADTGTGKTYITLHYAKEHGLCLFVVCPSAMSKVWFDLAEKYGVKLLTASSYDILRGDTLQEGNVKWYDMRNGYTKKSTTCPFIVKKGGKYEWKLPKEAIIVFDESHKAKNMETDNSKLLRGAKDYVLQTKGKLLLLSATPIEKNEDSVPLFFYLNLIQEPSFKQLTQLLAGQSQTSSLSPKRTNFVNMDYEKDHLQKCHKFLFNQKDPKAVRMSQEEYSQENGDDTENDIQVEVVELDEKAQAEIEAKYSEVSESLSHLKKSGKNGFAKMTEKLARIEYLKSPIFAKSAKKFRSNGFRVAIFLNFLESIDLVGGLLGERYVVLVGSQTKGQKDQAIEMFQKGEVKFLISTISCGGTGISLHDIEGDSPTCAIISPPSSATNLKQALGRVHRAGSKTSSKQIIIFSKNSSGKPSYEEKLAKRVRAKLKGISEIVSGSSFDLLEGLDNS